MLEFDFELKYTTSVKHANADFLSRISTQMGKGFEKDDFPDLMLLNVHE